jgi:ubiquinone/menaquinone biosynthesis C-methylase UbiE
MLPRALAGLVDVGMYGVLIVGWPIFRVVDHVFLVSVLGEIPDQQAAPGECRRVLERGGTLAVSETFPDPDYVRQPVLRERAARAGFEPAAVVSHLAGHTQRLRA